VATAVGTPVVAFWSIQRSAWGPYPPRDARHQVGARDVGLCAVHPRGHEFGTPQGCPARTCLAILEVRDVLAAAEKALAATRAWWSGSESPGGSRGRNSDTALRAPPRHRDCIALWPLRNADIVHAAWSRRAGRARCPNCAGVKRFRSLLKPPELARAIATASRGRGRKHHLRFRRCVHSLGPLIGFAIVGFGVGQASRSVRIANGRANWRQSPWRACSLATKLDWSASRPQLDRRSSRGCCSHLWWRCAATIDPGPVDRRPAGVDARPVSVQSQTDRDDVHRLAGRRVLVVGDLVLDEYVTGRPARISREAPVLILDVVEREDRAGSAAIPRPTSPLLGRRRRWSAWSAATPAGGRLENGLRRLAWATRADSVAEA